LGHCEIATLYVQVVVSICVCVYIYM
jgi:hypothetical protein